MYIPIWTGWRGYNLRFYRISGTNQVVTINQIKQLLNTVMPRLEKVKMIALGPVLFCLFAKTEVT